MDSSKRLFDILRKLDLPRTLQERLNVTVDKSIERKSFILYLPTIVLRQKHNPALTVACKLANHFNLPLLIFGVVLDDFYHNLKADQPIVSTARRLSFVLQAYQQAAQDWHSETGAAVLVRVHAPQGRMPHHLTLASQATVVVTDEPFVFPYRGFVQAVERAAFACVRVDGSTLVPPLSKLTKRSPDVYSGVPSKAWMWQKITDPTRKDHVLGVVKDGHFDAPSLQVSSPRDVLKETNALLQFFPQDWRDLTTDAPGLRPWTLDELLSIEPSTWSMAWPGVDSSVPPCVQSHGARGWSRWKQFQAKHLSKYAMKRNDIRQPHSVSRLSCYLNMGTVSIFQIVYELWQDRQDTKKFEDEIIKWREISYAHAFSTPDYFASTAVSLWAREYLRRGASTTGKYSLSDLALARTEDPTWNAMQNYLNETGELHNNARMTWGKTIVHWQKGLNLTELLKEMAFLNDRYALDGLSPPSYAGLLWCLGWCDKQDQNGGISTKSASRYRYDAREFARAKEVILERRETQPTIDQLFSFQHKKKQKHK